MPSKEEELFKALGESINPVNLMDVTQRFRLFFYGDTDCGKTSLACRLVKDKGLLVYGDSAWSVVKKYEDVAHKWDVVPFDGFAQLRTIAEAHSAGHPTVAKYDTLLIDPVSVAVNTMLRRVADQNKVKVEGWPEYRVVERYLTDTIEILNKSDLNIIYTAHQKFPSDADREKKQFAIRGNLPEACYNVIAREVQLIGYMFKEKRGAKRQIQLEGTLTESAKCQIPGIEETTYDVDEFLILMKKWRDNQ